VFLIGPAEVPAFANPLVRVFAQGVELGMEHIGIRTAERMAIENAGERLVAREVGKELGEETAAVMAHRSWRLVEEVYWFSENGTFRFCTAGVRNRPLEVVKAQPFGWRLGRQP
jgi:hypothetical protein